MTGTRVIDSHHHFFDPERGDYPWMEADEFTPIRRRWGADDFVAETAGLGVSHSILVQTWSSLAETENFLDLADSNEFIAGVVGWVDLTDEPERDIAFLLNLPHGQYLKGLRHQVHDEPDPEWLLRPEVRDGIRAVGDAGLVFDFLVRPRELPAALEIATAFPSIRFVIDHIAKPPIQDGHKGGWFDLIAPFGDLGNVACKASGLVTEASWSHWEVDGLQPYLADVFDVFGAERLMYGSDWPVCRVAASYADVLGIVETFLEPMDAKTRAAVLWLNAAHWYKLDI